MNEPRPSEFADRIDGKPLLAKFAAQLLLMSCNPAPSVPPGSRAARFDLNRLAPSSCGAGVSALWEECGKRGFWSESGYLVIPQKNP